MISNKATFATSLGTVLQDAHVTMRGLRELRRVLTETPERVIRSAYCLGDSQCIIALLTGVKDRAQRYAFFRDRPALAASEVVITMWDQGMVTHDDVLAIVNKCIWQRKACNRAEKQQVKNAKARLSMRSLVRIAQFHRAN